MPQSGKKDVASQRAQDKESKRARGEFTPARRQLSLREYQAHYLVQSAGGTVSPNMSFLYSHYQYSLKLKCDKTVPCSRWGSRSLGALCLNYNPAAASVVGVQPYVPMAVSSLDKGRGMYHTS